MFGLQLILFLLLVFEDHLTYYRYITSYIFPTKSLAISMNGVEKQIYFLMNNHLALSI